ncbi:hypothetical protein [Burkholderia pseudomultivorans]|uniref:hypothetical protein n=1 Tax=Burkholderia pseudomultivorans TaxID=1207504 RepID=UPI00286FB6B7|nr:hypothetical protein [Burkholderia pseudomultivorans]
MSAPAWTDEWPTHARRPDSMRALRFSRMSSQRPCRCSAVAHASAAFARAVVPFLLPAAAEPVKCAPSSRGWPAILPSTARPFRTKIAIMPRNYIVGAIRAITIRR